MPEETLELGDFVIGQIAITADDIGSEMRSRIEVMPEGEYVHHQAGKMTITREHLDQLLADVNSRGDKIPLDYDHSAGKGQGSRAAGWFVRGSATIEPSAADPEKMSLYADVQWTPQAAVSIQTGEYRFISPEWNFRWKDRNTGSWVRKARLFAATLTNRPFFDQMGPVHLCDASLESLMAEDNPSTNAGESGEKEETMSLTPIAEALGLAADADQEAVLAAIAASAEKKEGGKEGETSAPAFDEKTLATLVASAAAGQQAANDLATMRRDSVLDKAIEKRKIDPAQREQYATLWAANADSTEKLLASMKEGSWEPKGSEGSTETAGAVLATAGSHEALYGHNPPAKVTADGQEYDVDEQSRKLHVKALEILATEGKISSYTAEQYVAAVSAAASQEGIAL